MDDSRAMVDTNVLIFASRPPKKGEHPTLPKWRAISREVLQRMPRIRICAIAWGEFIRGLRAEELSEHKAWFEKIEAEAVDARVMARAVELHKARGLHEKTCATCGGGIAKTTTCEQCGRPRASKQLLNDAIVVAHAEVAADVDKLYCFDGPATRGFRPHIDPSALKIVSLDDPEFYYGPLFKRGPELPVNTTSPP